MMRRKGIPGDCCGDTCGNKVRKINGISPDPNGEFNISAGAGVGITEDENGIIIDASAASGVLTINGEAPDADGNFDGVVTVGDAQDIKGLKTFKTPIGPFIQVSHPYPGSATDYADIDQYVNNILSNRIRMQRNGTTNENSIQLMPRNITGGTGGLPLSVNFNPATNKMYAMAPVRDYDPINENDIVTIGSLKQSTDVMRTENVIPLNGGIFLQKNIVIPDISASTLIRQFDVQAKKTADGEYFTIGSMQYRRYANRTRWRTMITRYMDTPEGTTSLIFDVFDSGRVYLFIENIVNGTTTNHTIIDSTP